MDLKEGMRSHYTPKREMGFIEVPEWGGKVFFIRRPNVREWVEISKAFEQDVAAAQVTTFLLMARKEDGTRLFNSHERLFIEENCDPAVLRRVVGEMGIFEALAGESVENGKKS